MSLEQALAENTAALNRLATILQSGAILPAGTATPVAAAAAAAAAEPTAPKGTRAKKETPATTAQPAAAIPGATGAMRMPLGVANAGTLPSLGLQAGDPEGTLYFHIESHRTVAAVKPGEIVPNMAGIAEVDGATYAALKAKYAAPVPSSGAAAAGGAAAAPASTTPAASTASPQVSAQPQPASTATSPVLDGPAITAKCQALHKAQGNAGLKQVLDKFAVTNVPGLVQKTAEYPLIANFIDSLLNPQPAAQPAEANLFG